MKLKRWTPLQGNSNTALSLLDVSWHVGRAHIQARPWQRRSRWGAVAPARQRYRPIS